MFQTRGMTGAGYKCTCNQMQLLLPLECGLCHDPQCASRLGLAYKRIPTARPTYRTRLAQNGPMSESP
jgi:hypothetical protein